jgi:hypothetical protein
MSNDDKAPKQDNDERQITLFGSDIDEASLTPGMRRAVGFLSALGPSVGEAVARGQAIHELIGIVVGDDPMDFRVMLRSEARELYGDVPLVQRAIARPSAGNVMPVVLLADRSGLAVRVLVGKLPPARQA